MPPIRTPIRIPIRTDGPTGRTALAATLVVLAIAATSCGPGGTEETAIFRGDQAFARDSLDEALAEYRLAVRQGSDDPEALARVAHTYARVNRVDEARDFYRRAVEADADLADQAAADFVHVARDAAERNDRFLMASAMDAALSFRPGLSVQEMALPLARHYSTAGEYGRALPFYQRALAARPDSSPELVFEIAKVHEQIGDCQRALVFFEQYREMIPRWERGEVDWYVGNCAFQLAREKRLAARKLAPTRDTAAADTTTSPDRSPRPSGSRAELLEDARRHIERTIEVQQPRNLLGQAWFEKGEILAAIGDCEGALDAFDRVTAVEPSSSTSLARRAQERYDQIFFGRGLRDLTTAGTCG